MSNASNPVIGVIRPVRVAAALADEIRSRVLSGELADGSLLPSERELSEQAGLSRSSVREALCILETEGLIVIRRGRGNGVRVRRPGAETLSRTIRLVTASDESRSSLIEFRKVLEPSCAELAANKRLASGLEALAQCNGEMEDCVRRLERGENVQGNLIKINTRWHIAVAAATGNMLLSKMMEAIDSLLTSAVRAEFEVNVYGDDSIWKVVLAAHQAISSAILEGDGEAAFRRMRRHVESYANIAEVNRAFK